MNKLPFVRQPWMNYSDSSRALVRYRDDETCQICLKVWNGKGRRFDVHHIMPELEGKGVKGVSLKPQKMITLCVPCHQGLIHNRLKHCKTEKGRQFVLSSPDLLTDEVKERVSKRGVFVKGIPNVIWEKE